MTGELKKAKIEGIAAGGAGFARIEGKSVFIEGTIPGEIVICRITEDHPSWSKAELLEIEEASPEREQPICSEYGKCGGCNLQHLGYPAQLTAKTAILIDTLTRIGGIDPPEPQVFPSEPWEYRNRMQFHAIRQGIIHESSPFLGQKMRKNADIIPISDCPIADPGIREVLRGDKKQKLSLLPPEKDRFSVYARGGLFLSEGGISRGKTTVLDQELALDAAVFFQSNGEMLEKLIGDLLGIVANMPDRSLPMADLYCGVGTFAAFLGKMFPKVDLVEENKAALAIARENLVSLKSAAFFAQRSAHWAKNGIPRRYSFIIADPPRHGLGRSLALSLASGGHPLLAYVSCDPAALARDSKTLLTGGYRLIKLYFYDFYPQTSHIESLALFKKPDL